MVGNGVMMEKTGGDKLLAKNSQQSDLYNYNLDHVYCSDGNSRYRTTTGTHLNLAAAASDLKSLRKENKQLQAMLLLHLDLIQEQSNQLIAKDKQLLQLREENAQLRLKCERTASSAAVAAAAAVAERRQNNNRYTTAHSSGGKVLNTSDNSPTIDSYFTTADTKLSTNRSLQQQQHHDISGKLKSQNTITINQNPTINSNSCDENQAFNEIRTNQMTMPKVKVEVNTTTPDEPSHAPSTPTSMMKMIMHSNSDIGHTTTTTSTAGTTIKERSFKTILTPTTLGSHDKPITAVKYRTVDNSIIGNNNGKLISKIILQRKKSENGEKIFVRTKNIDIGNSNINNKTVFHEKWSPLRTIKNEVIECSDMEPIVLEATQTTTTAALTAASASASATMSTATTTITSPTSNTMAAIHDDDISSDAMEASYLTASAGLSSTPSIKTIITTTPTTLMDHSDLSTDCQIDHIKIEQDDMHDGDNEEDDDDHEDDDDDDDDDEDDHGSSPVYDPNSTLEDSQDTLNVESSLTSEMPTIAPTPCSPITSTVSTSDFNQSENCMDNNSMTMSTTTTMAGSTILYPVSRRHINRNAFLTTKKPYKIREWQLDEIEAELKQEITDEVCKEENEANLELPKWRTWELSSNREVPVTAREWEDLSDETFARRHARFLLDERKRKKWDVQRIREQRTIERLKRRHCKDELNQQKDFNEVVTTFFPTVDQLKSIHITDDLPVSAFGESIPALPPSEFSLPWQIGSGHIDGISKSDFLNAPIDQSVVKSRSNSICSSASINESTAQPSHRTHVSSIIFLQTKKRAGRTRTSTITSTIPTNTKSSTT